MKIRSSRQIHITAHSFEEFKLAEFSKNVFQFVPNDQLSCNHCENEEDESAGRDNALSFLIKFKADQLNDPRKITSEGVAGYFLLEGDGLNYRQEPGSDSNFTSIRANHFNLYATQEQLDRIALKAYSDVQMQSIHSAKDVSDYLLSKYNVPEWEALLALENKKGWKKFVKRLLRQTYESRFGKVLRTDLKKAHQFDPETVLQKLKELNSYGCLLPGDLEEIRIALGRDLLS